MTSYQLFTWMTCCTMADSTETFLKTMISRVRHIEVIKINHLKTTNFSIKAKFLGTISLLK